MNALAAVRLPLLHGLTAAVTALFVAWFTQSVLREADLTLSGRGRARTIPL